MSLNRRLSEQVSDKGDALSKDRVLTIILCETRAWQATWTSFYENIIQTLDSDLALCVSRDESNLNPFHEHANYEWVIEEPSNWANQYSSVAGNDQWKTLLEVGRGLIGEIDDKSCPKLGSGAIQFYFRHLLRGHLLSNGLLEQYDWFLVVRSDFIWLAPHPPLKVLSKEGITVLDGENYGGVCDRYALIPVSLMSDYLEIAEPIFFDPEKLRIEMETAIANGQVDGANPEAFLKVRYVELGFWDNLVRIPYFGFAVRLPNGATRGSHGKFSKKLGVYVKYPREYTASRVLSTSVKTSLDWILLLRRRTPLNSRALLLEAKLTTVFLSQRIGRVLKRLFLKFKRNFFKTHDR